MYQILCYGDSNTYGFNPSTGLRYDAMTRWTGRLQALLGENYHVIEEGCNGRTTCYSTEDEPWKNGWTTLHACLNTHKPIDLVVLMLGTNDLKDEFHALPEEIAENIRRYAVEIKAFTLKKQSYPAQVLIISPPHLGTMENSSFGASFSDKSREKSCRLHELYEQAALKTGSLFLDAGTIVTSSKIDSLHLDAEAHSALAKAIAEHILKYEGRDSANV